jgi:hypothetical protein
MRGTRSNGQPTRVKDPDWRPTPAATGFWPLPADHELTTCTSCAAVVPASDRAQQRHRAFHEQVAGLEDGRTP